MFSPDTGALATVISVFPPSSAVAELPSPNSRQQRDILMATQPEFFAACNAGIEAARRAQCADGSGNTNSSAVRSWGRFTINGLHTHMMRTDVKPDSPWTQRMAEINIVESWAWWLVTQVGVTPATAKDYMHTANAWHERFVGYGLGAGLPLTRVSKMLDGLARLQGVPPPKRFRIGVRPKHLRQAIDAGLDTRDSLNANYATAFEVCLVAIARAGEIASGLPHGTFDVTRHPSRADLTFQFDNTGSPISATIMIVNSKARGIEARRKLPVVLPMRGEYLSPGHMLWTLVARSRYRSSSQLGTQHYAALPRPGYQQNSYRRWPALITSRHPVQHWTRRKRLWSAFTSHRRRYSYGLLPSERRSHQGRRTLEQRRISSLHPRVPRRAHVIHDTYL